MSEATGVAASRQVYDSKCLAGTTLFVTGASSGIGRASATALSQLGARLVLSGRDQARLEQAQQALAGYGHAIIPTELTDADATAEVVKSAAREHGPFNGIFHAAGAFSVFSIKITKQRHIDETFGASVFGAYGIARAAAGKNVLVDGGSVVFISSVAAMRGSSGLTAYAGAKAAILGLNTALAHELAPRRIRVNTIVASTIETEMHLRTVENADMTYVERNRARHPLGFGQPDDVANGVVFLMSDASRWVTGSTLAIDGGYLA
jgi:NAD(P)-dependent dehydrogenase (short-subunit alcohol dehydrogenase family)